MHLAVPLRLAVISTVTRETASLCPRWIPVGLLGLTLVLLSLSAWAGHPALLVAGTVSAFCAAWAWRRSRMRPTRIGQAQVLLRERRLEYLRDAKAVEPLLLLSLHPRFGFTLFATADRTRLAVAITNGHGTVCIGSDLGPTDRRRLGVILSRAVTVCRDDLSMATRLPSGDDLLVDSTSLLRLIDALTQEDGTAFGRVLLSDAKGREVILDGDRLTTSCCTIRLDQPFEWRGFRFREGADFQGTWVRQGKNEVVFVALLVDDVRRSIHDLAKVKGFRPDMVLRLDRRLAEGVRCKAPPLDQRIAVDRLFMLPLRRALDGAHVERRDSIPGDASLG